MHDLIVHSTEPLNAEPSLTRLRAAFVTPRQDFYIRSHGDIPRLDAADFVLRVAGLISTPLSLNLSTLRERFPERQVMAVMQCAGNRRADLNALHPVTGDPWGPGAIGNAVWTGVSLADVLHAAAARSEAELHVVFDAADRLDHEHTFGASIPMTKALCPDVLLAYAMNGETLSPEHGFPLRVVVPGYAGVRSPKWLTCIRVSETPSSSPVQQQDYKLFPPDVTAETVDRNTGMTIQQMPLNAAICSPADGASVPSGPVRVLGYATASDRAVTRVDVSADGGHHWRQAALKQQQDSPWAWAFWEATMDLDPGDRELAVRAWDSAGQTQPDRPDDVWNFKGYLCSSWHRVRIHVM